MGSTTLSDYNEQIRTHKSNTVGRSKLEENKLKFRLQISKTLKDRCQNLNLGTASIVKWF